MAEDRAEDSGLRSGQSLMPISTIRRIIEQAIPSGAEIDKEALKAMECYASQFLHMVTIRASEKCREENREIVNGDDALWALTTARFPHYVDYLKLHSGNAKGLDDGNQKDGPETSTLRADQADALQESRKVEMDGAQSQAGRQESSPQDEDEAGALHGRSSSPESSASEVVSRNS